MQRAAALASGETGEPGAAHQQLHRPVPVVWVGAEVDRALDAHEFDVREPGVLEDSVDPIRVGERERARPLRRRERSRDLR